MSGTLSGDRFTDRAFLSKASLRILFLVAEPQSLYKPVARNKAMVFIARAHMNAFDSRHFLSFVRYLPIMSSPLLSTSSTQRHTIIGTFGTPIAKAVETPPGTPPVLVSRLTYLISKKREAYYISEDLNQIRKYLISINLI